MDLTIKAGGLASGRVNASCSILGAWPAALADADSTISAVGWSLVVAVVALVALVGVMRLRKWLKEDDVSAGGVGFTLSDLRRLQREGKITDEEFERARSKMVEAGRALAAKLPHPLEGRRPPAEPKDPGQSPPSA